MLEGILEGILNVEYLFTVLLLLSGAIKYIPPKQQRKTSYVEYTAVVKDLTQTRSII